MRSLKASEGDPGSFRTTRLRHQAAQLLEDATDFLRQGWGNDLQNLRGDFRSSISQDLGHRTGPKDHINLNIRILQNV